MPATRSAPATATQISRFVRDMRRILRQRLRSRIGGEPLPGPAVELLRLVQEQDGVRVGDAARALRIAPNTASTLVRQLTEAGLVHRMPDAHDGRVARLALTAAGRERLNAWHDQRQTLIADALAGLCEADQVCIEAAMPALERLVRAVDGLAPDEPPA